MKTSPLCIGTAAWSIPKIASPIFGAEGSHLERYSRVLTGVEINTSFYRDHKLATYQRWANDTPEEFRFAVKVSKAFTHEQGLVTEASEVHKAVEGYLGLGEKLDVLLIQLPPKLAFNRDNARAFLEQIRERYEGAMVIEPRHKTWIGPDALEVLREFRLNKVIADPEPCPSDDEFQKTSHDAFYVRWHGSPVIYESRYEAASLESLWATVRIAAETYKSVWAIFDNTTYGWATVNALEFLNMSQGKAKIPTNELPVSLL